MIEVIGLRDMDGELQQVPPAGGKLGRSWRRDHRSIAGAAVLLPSVRDHLVGGLHHGDLVRVLTLLAHRLELPLAHRADRARPPAECGPSSRPAAAAAPWAHGRGGTRSIAPAPESPVRGRLSEEGAKIFFLKAASCSCRRSELELEPAPSRHAGGRFPPSIWRSLSAG